MKSRVCSNLAAVGMLVQDGAWYFESIATSGVCMTQTNCLFLGRRLVFWEIVHSRFKSVTELLLKSLFLVSLTAPVKRLYSSCIMLPILENPTGTLGNVPHPAWGCFCGSL